MRRFSDSAAIAGFGRAAAQAQATVLFVAAAAALCAALGPGRARGADLSELPVPPEYRLSSPVLLGVQALSRAAGATASNWDVKLGLSTSLDPLSSWQRLLAPTPERVRAGALPSMHVSGQGWLSERWLLSVNAESLSTSRGQGLDMDLRVDYSLTPNFFLYGGYRLTDSTGDGPAFYGFLPANSARFGVRLRF